MVVQVQTQATRPSQWKSEPCKPGPFIGHSPRISCRKLETYEDITSDRRVLALFRESWAREHDQAELRDDEEPSQLGLAGEALVTKYLDEVAPAIEPAAVELHVEGEIGGVRVQGHIDILDVNRIIDIKTAKASPSDIEPMNRFQIATYSQLSPDASGKGRLDILVKTKTPKVVLQEALRSPRKTLRATQTLYIRAGQAMRSEHYMPNRLSMFCSRRHCAYWRICECEWGGEVPET